MSYSLLGASRRNRNDVYLDADNSKSIIDVCAVAIYYLVLLSYELRLSPAVLFHIFTHHIFLGTIEFQNRFL